MPRTNNDSNKKTEKVNKSGKERAKTRRRERGTSIPIFAIRRGIYLSCYDIRNFLADKEDVVKEKLRYEFRKKYQKMERKTPCDRLILTQKEIKDSIRTEDIVHLNPNKKNIFLKITQIENENGEFRYLKDLYQIPIDKNKIIKIERPIIDPSFEINESLIYESLNEIRCFSK